MTPDIINGTFELLGGLFLLFNCWKTYQAKIIRGVSIVTTTFFASWGVWNLYYYPHLDQFWSFAGGVVIVSANALWIFLMIYYTRRERVEFNTGDTNKNTIHLKAEAVYGVGVVSPLQAACICDDTGKPHPGCLYPHPIVASQA